MGRHPGIALNGNLAMRFASRVIWSGIVFAAALSAAGEPLNCEALTTGDPQLSFQSGAIHMAEWRKGDLLGFNPFNCIAFVGPKRGSPPDTREMQSSRHE